MYPKQLSISVITNAKWQSEGKKIVYLCINKIM
jgi:hypothetical protein